MGTVAYMSPEQASGSAVDKRSDIWSFGVVLFELLAGRRLFEGETSSHTMADVLRADIDWSRLPASTPGPIRKLLERCLERDRKRRLQAIGEARIIIEDYLANASPSGSRSVAIPAFVAPAEATARAVDLSRPSRSSRCSARSACSGVSGAADAGRLALRADIKISDAPLFTDVGSSIELSPDATRLVYVVGLHADPATLRAAAQSARRHEARGRQHGLDLALSAVLLARRTVDRLRHGSEMRKVPVSGGTPLTLCKVTRSRGASWRPDGTIVFTPTPASALFRVSAAGGEAQPLTTLDKAKKEVTHRWPQVLPGGKAVIFTSHTQSTADFDNATIEVLILATGERKVLQKGGSYGRYVPSGHLVYVSKATLFAVPFDLARSRSPARRRRSCRMSSGTRRKAQRSLRSRRPACSPTCAADPRSPSTRSSRSTAEGARRKLLDEAGAYGNPRLSPDGKRLSLTVLRDGNFDIWVYDLERGVPTRLTFDDAPDTEQVWSPDGRFIVFSSGRAGADNLYRKRADGSGEEERLTKSDDPMWANSWSQDGAIARHRGHGAPTATSTSRC